MTDIEGFLTIYGHSDNLLNNNGGYLSRSIMEVTASNPVQVYFSFLCLFVCFFCFLSFFLSFFLFSF